MNVTAGQGSWMELHLLPQIPGTATWRVQETLRSFVEVPGGYSSTLLSEQGHTD